MGFAQLFTILQSLGAVLGVILTIITFWGVVSKKPKEKIRNAFREEAKEANKELINKINIIDQKMKNTDETNLAILRNTITHIYFKYKDSKKIPHYEKENVLYLYENYEKLNGNSYVKDIITNIKTWEEII